MRWRLPIFPTFAGRDLFRLTLPLRRVGRDIGIADVPAERR